jgi:UDP-2-acetamido-2,6-beta-L-arabino-hexul-4-ose reductase
VFTFAVSGDQPVAVDMPPLYAHSLTNVGDDDLLTVFWTNDHFSAIAPDTYPEPVEAARVGAGV